MKLSDFLDQLAHGALSQHTIGSTGSIKAKDLPKVLNQINLGLTNLHARLPLRTNEVIVQQMDNVTDYPLSSKYAASNLECEHPFIMDTDAHPFQDDVVRIDSAFDEAGNEVPLNNEYEPDSWFTPTNTMLQVPKPVSTNVSVVIYRANHPKVVDDMAFEIELPVFLYEALEAFVAKRLYTSMGNQASAALSSYYDQRYEQLIMETERHNLLQGSHADTNIKFFRGGWV